MGIDPQTLTPAGQERARKAIVDAGLEPVVANIDVIVTAWLGSRANDGTDESLALLSMLLCVVTGDDDAVAYFDEFGVLAVEAVIDAGTVH